MTENWKPLVSDAELEKLIVDYGNDFTKDAADGRFDPITGRDKELDDLILILLQRGRKNAVLLGPAGIGKTALAIGLAQRVAADNVPQMLKGARVIEIDMARMASGTNGPAEFQARFIPFCKGIAERERIKGMRRTILFIDEIHQIMPTCEGSSYKGLSNVMKPYLTIGDMMVVGATTDYEFREYVALDPALDRRFQKINLREPDAKETYVIMKAIRGGYEKHHGVSVSDTLLRLIVALTEEHMKRRTQPDKSIITLDSALAYHVQNKSESNELDAHSIYYMIGREAGLAIEAIDDPKLLAKLDEETKSVQ